MSIWEVAFKPNTDDIREAPSLVLLESLWEHGVRTTVYDPKAMPALKKQSPNQALLEYAENPILACRRKMLCLS